MPRGWKDWVRGIAIWGIGPNDELTRIRTDERGYLQVLQVPHHHTHEDGGSDEINVQGLSGVLRDLQRGKFSFVGNYADFPTPGEPERLAFAVDRLTIYRDTGTSWQKVATAHWDYIEGAPSDFFPAPHAETHEEGGSDALDPAKIGANWSKLVNVPSAFPPLSHGSTHQPGGSDGLPTAAPAPITEGATGAEGSSTAFARADHVHEAPAEWTPKEHGNEKHNPDFFPIDGSSRMKGDIRGDSRNPFYKLMGFVLPPPSSFQNAVIPLFFYNDIAFVDKRGGSITSSPSPDYGSLSNIVDGTGNPAKWANPSGNIVVEITLHKYFWVAGHFWVLMRSYEAARNVRIEVYREDGVWVEVSNVAGVTDGIYCGYVNIANTHFNKIRFTFSDFVSSSYFTLVEVGYIYYVEARPSAYNLWRAGDTVYGDIDMNGNDIVNPGLVDGVDVSSHASRHENGGADEINVNGLSGQLADPQKTTWDLVANKPSTFPPSAHASSHQDGGSDELSVGKLDGTWGGATQVYNANAPVGWTLLNLSSYVGSRRALVFLKIKNNGSSDTLYNFRTTGDTDAYSMGTDWSHASGCRIEAGKCGTVLVITDASGRVDWYAAPGSSTTVWLLGYIALS